MPQLLSPNDLPDAFVYPRSFIRVLELGLTNLEPWRILEAGELYERQLGVERRYPNRKLVSFARRQDNDDIACWDLNSDVVVLIHDYATPGFEQRESFPDFYAWLRRAIEDLIDFDP